MHFLRLQNAFDPTSVFGVNARSRRPGGGGDRNPTDPQRASLPWISSMSIKIEAEWFPR